MLLVQLRIAVVSKKLCPDQRNISKRLQAQPANLKTEKQPKHTKTHTQK
jgi:hypothetical protein